MSDSRSVGLVNSLLGGTVVDDLNQIPPAFLANDFDICGNFDFQRCTDTSFSCSICPQTLAFFDGTRNVFLKWTNSRGAKAGQATEIECARVGRGKRGLRLEDGARRT